ncbi:hypothetical protein HHL28_06680 [Aerophototrophica crusticola]|uniref:Uncharacterized protein n=1 Tax=Aerophototrophica crusticola TaxID=1709002 RepID=A0A858R604_9PROT|nr:hypothetical protein HHL28_06680 [Rhodospirillaceae bacterium B3]
MPRRLPLALIGLLALGACASPCDRIKEDMRQLNADTIRNPGIALDGTYMSRFQELAAQSVEHRCLEKGELF